MGKREQEIVQQAVEMILAVLLCERGAALVERACGDDKTAELFAWAAREFRR